MRAKEWAAPLGKVLQTSGVILSTMGKLGLPGANIIGGALSIGATLLNPKPLKEDMQMELSEIQTDISEVKTDMKRILKEVEHSNTAMVEEMSKMKSLISQTFHIVVDTRYKVSLPQISREGWETEQKFTSSKHKSYLERLDQKSEENRLPQKWPFWVDLHLQENFLAILGDYGFRQRNICFSKSSLLPRF